MTKAELEGKLQEAVNLGNEMVEHLEFIHGDEVITAYRAKVRDFERPFITSPVIPDPLDELLEEDGMWDCFVGDLQRAGVVDKELMARPAVALYEADRSKLPLSDGGEAAEKNLPSEQGEQSSSSTSTPAGES